MTRYLVDTNVLSELVGTTPDAAVLEFMRHLPSAELFLSAISRFEIERGLGLMPAGRRRELYEQRYRTLIDSLGGILPLDDAAASAGASIALAARARGNSLDAHLFDVLDRRLRGRSRTHRAHTQRAAVSRDGGAVREPLASVTGGTRRPGPTAARDHAGPLSPRMEPAKATGSGVNGRRG